LNGYRTVRGRVWFPVEKGLKKANVLQANSVRGRKGRVWKNQRRWNNVRGAFRIIPALLLSAAGAFGGRPAYNSNAEARKGG